MVERFLLHFFTQSAHTNTRGTFTTPESTTLDRDGYDYGYGSAGLGNVAMCLKWMLCFEEPETRTLWLGKAVPRDWLAAGEAPLNAQNVTTRYGRISFALTVAMAADTSPSFSPSSTSSSASVPSTSAAAYVVHANITLPASYADKATQPAGGIRLRIRAPMAHAGKLSKVTIGGQPWTAFNAAEETVDISAEKLTAALIAKGLPTIVATFEAKHAVPLLEARYIPANRVIPTLPPAAAEVLLKPQASAKTSVRNPPTALADAAAPTAPAIPAAPAVCPDKMEEVDHFDINGTGWLACEDLHQPGGSIALVPAAGDVEWFSKAYSPYKTVTDDGSYYLGLTKQTVAAAKTDVLGAKLLEQKFITWADVEKAIPPIRTASAGGGCSAGCPGGVRTFVGSRGASVDTTMDNQGNDCNYNGWPVPKILHLIICCTRVFRGPWRGRKWPRLT